MKKIAVLYQKNLPPIKNGIQKPMKQGGYSDSGADIAFSLRTSGLNVITPNNNPSETADLDWVFPDSEQGILEAKNKGAEVFWLNTVLYKGHPIEAFFDGKMEIIGQDPTMVDDFDDKLFTNKLLANNGIPIPSNILIEKNGSSIPELPFPFPVVIKPIRGRGSQGVFLVKNKEELITKTTNLFSKEIFGNAIYAEYFLTGQEITLTIMPPGIYKVNSENIKLNKHWSLPPVKRLNHHNGIAPYSGNVAVINNSKVLDVLELETKEIKCACQHSEYAAKLLNARAPIRIDCRADENGNYHLFDVNLKPNMTGASRHHRKDQDSLSTIAAQQIGWNYNDLLINILNQKWVSK